LANASHFFAMSELAVAGASANGVERTWIKAHSRVPRPRLGTRERGKCRRRRLARGLARRLARRLALSAAKPNGHPTPTPRPPHAHPTPPHAHPTPVQNNRAGRLLGLAAPPTGLTSKRRPLRAANGRAHPTPDTTRDAELGQGPISSAWTDKSIQRRRGGAGSIGAVFHVCWEAPIDHTPPLGNRGRRNAR